MRETRASKKSGFLRGRRDWSNLCSHFYCTTPAPIEPLIAGFAHHARVFDAAAIAPYETTDGERIESFARGDELACEIGGYHLAARREDAWDAIVACCGRSTLSIVATLAN